MSQGGAVIRGPSTGVAGSSIVVEVTANASNVQVSYGGAEGTKSIPIPPGGKVTIPIPAGYEGVIGISIGRNANRRGITVEVPSTSP